MILRFFLGLLLLVVVYETAAQTGSIQGVVLNSRTYDRLPFSTIFINYTTLATSANERGEFVLKNIPLGQHELIVTFVGHHPYQAKITLKDTSRTSVTIHLKSNELREVQIQAKRDKNWERQYQKFKTLFLGASHYAMGCEVVNPWVLEFHTNARAFFRQQLLIFCKLKITV